MNTGLVADQCIFVNRISVSIDSSSCSSHQNYSGNIKKNIIVLNIKIEILQVELNPLENAITTIEAKITELKEIMENVSRSLETSDDIDYKDLTRHLNGKIL